MNIGGTAWGSQTHKLEETARIKTPETYFVVYFKFVSEVLPATSNN